MKIAFAGGGTLGHIYPSISVAQHLKKDEILFLISKAELDEQVLKDSGFFYKQIYSGKLRRYFSFLNFLDFFKFIFGIFQSIFLLKKNKVSLVFSKGGFVALPVCIGAWFLKIPIFLHESDFVMGLSNKIISKFSTKIFFGIRDGNPVRSFKEEKFELKTNKKILFVIGGSQGAKELNDFIENIFEKISEKYFVICTTGKGKKINISNKNFLQFEFLEAGKYFSILKQAEIILSRAGAGSLAEILFFEKKSIIIPLKSAAGNHQEKNARFFENKNLLKVLLSKDLDEKIFLEILNSDFGEIVKNLKKQKKIDFGEKIYLEMKGYLRK